MKFSIAAILFQILLIILFATLAEYDPTESGPVKGTDNSKENRLYPSR